MKTSTMLTVASLVAATLGSIHLATDFVYGKEATQSGTGLLITVPILVFWVYGSTVFAGRRAGYIMSLIASMFGMLILGLHWIGKIGVGSGPIAQASGPVLFVWVLLVLGATSLFAFILSLHGLWEMRRSASIGELR